MKGLVVFTTVLLSFLLLPARGKAQSEQPLPRWRANTNVRVFAIRDDFTVDENPRILAAIASWQPLLPDFLGMEFAGMVDAPESCAGCVTIKRESTPGDERGECELHHHDGRSDYALIRIDPRLKDDKDFQRAIEHELGHALGLGHMPGSVMSPRQPKCHPSERDGARLRSLYSPESSLSLYRFRRTVTIREGNQTLVRRSVFTFNDRGERVETEIIETGSVKGISEKFWGQFPMFPLGIGISAKWAASSARTFTVVWRDGPEIVQDGAEGMWFPVEALTDRIQVKFYDYKLFRTSVTVKEIE